MLDRHFVDSFLHLNDISPNASDADLRAAFAGAGWSETEIDRAFKILKNEDPTVRSITPDNVASELLRPGRQRSSQDLSLLLGVDVIVDPQSVRGVRRGVHGHSHIGDIFMSLLAIVLAVAFATILGVLLMQYLNVGPYYSPV